MENEIMSNEDSKKNKKLPKILLIFLFFLAVALTLLAALSNETHKSEDAPDVYLEQESLSLEKDAAESLISFEDIIIETEEKGDSFIGIFKNRGVEVGRIEENYPFEVRRLSRSQDALFFTTDPMGQGGYILFEGTRWNLYKMDIKSAHLEKVYDGMEPVMAVSNDGSKLVVRSGKDGFVLFKIIDLSGQNEYETFEVPKKYKQAGNVVFSPDDSRIIYKAAVGDPDIWEEEYGFLGIDLNLKDQQEFDYYEYARQWAKISGI